MEFFIKEQSWLAKAAAKKLHSQNVALVLGKTIHLYNISKEHFLLDERWVKHEMCHINQFAKYGFLTFTIKYLWESIRHGYFNNRYEIEARQAEDN